MVFPIRHALRGELTCTHYRSILRVENPPAREFYINEPIANGREAPPGGDGQGAPQVVTATEHSVYLETKPNR
ncbi:MAG: hypothetical protein IPN33_01970 [Saprospiraceae bacterium]|nr:hypothetical protein [Saprospiraceae bacterium]